MPYLFLNAASGFYLLYLLTEAFLLAFYNAHLLRDARTPDTDARDRRLKWWWHAEGAALHAANAALGWYVQGPELAFFVLVLFWVVFAGIVHQTGLQKSFFYVGTTALDDRAQQWLYRRGLHRLFGSIETMSAVLKITTFVISLTLLILAYLNATKTS